MEKKMNKKEIIEKLQKETSYDKDQCTQITETLESQLFIGREGRNTFIRKIGEQLKLDEEEASQLYETVHTIFTAGLKDSLMHPFRGKENN